MYNEFKRKNRDNKNYKLFLFDGFFYLVLSFEYKNVEELFNGIWKLSICDEK